MGVEKNIVVIELGSSSIRAMIGQKKPDGSLQILGFEKESAPDSIHKGVVYNIDKTIQAVAAVIKRIEERQKVFVNKVYVGVTGQSLRTIGNTVKRQLDVKVAINDEIIDSLRDENRLQPYPNAEILDFSHKLSVPGAGGGFQVETSGLVYAFPTDMGFRDREMDEHLRKPAGLLVVIAVAMAVRRKQCIRLQFLQYREILSEILGNVAHRLVFHRNVSLYVHAVQRHIHQTFAGQVDGRHRCLQVLDFEEFLLEVRSKLT